MSMSDVSICINEQCVFLLTWSIFLVWWGGVGVSTLSIYKWAMCVCMCPSLSDLFFVSTLV